MEVMIVFDVDPEMVSIIFEIIEYGDVTLLNVKAKMDVWYETLSDDEKMKIMERGNELMAEKGMILVGGEGTLKPDHELPHGPENAIKRRKRERKEKKIGEKCRARAVAEAYRDYLKEEVDGGS